MQPREKRPVFLGEAVVRSPGTGDQEHLVTRAGELFYKISNYHAMQPFLMSVASGYDHWLFVSSTGGLTCGRRVPENALFPYCTDDKIHDASETTGPRTVLLVESGDRAVLWQPFGAGPSVYNIQRNLYKNLPGNKVTFEEVNHDLGLSFSYTWTVGQRFGFIRRSELVNLEATRTRVSLLDGLRNLLPHGVDRTAQAELSTLVDAYKQAERIPGTCAAIYSLTSMLTDRAEPSEALRASVVWSHGLKNVQVLLSEDQVREFGAGADVRPETACKGRRCAFFVHSDVIVAPRESLRWYVLADVDQGPSELARLLQAIRQGITAEAIEADVADGTARLERLAGRADGYQKCSDDLITGRHLSNVLSNIMRGGVFPHEYTFPRQDFLDFTSERNRTLRGTVEAVLERLQGPLTLGSAQKLAQEENNADFTRLVHEYLPLTFSRRHGDPSRPWNHFTVNGSTRVGKETLDYQGNWRDIFQNWEALALSFPEYVESFIAKFVNASTADGNNPYRVSRNGFEWETPQPEHAWSNIGYWGDHQVCYLLRLLELSRGYHPGLLGQWLQHDVFVYADVPYRIKPYDQMIRDPRQTLLYDHESARASARRVAEIGSDGKLVTLKDGSIYRVNLLEKLLVSALARLVNLVPAGGIWMNTQRPEWNDANNALAGYGLSMVTVCYLRRFLRVLEDVLRETAATEFAISREVAQLCESAGVVLMDHRALTAGPVRPGERRSFMDAMGRVAERYRDQVYSGFDGEKVALGKEQIQDLVGIALEHVEHGLAQSRRQDGLFHSYNLLRLGDGECEVEPLDEMLEGQVAILSSGFLDASGALALLDALRASRLYRTDQASYLLYPERDLPSFLEKNVIPPQWVESDSWLTKELEAGRTEYVERDVEGQVHFNGRFRNARQLRAALDADPAVQPGTANMLCAAYEAVFRHQRFTGRSGSMYKYEGLGCIYWHMVSKLLLATGEVISRAVEGGVSAGIVRRLSAHFQDIQDGLGLHKSPAVYGAFPTDPYSHTPSFAGVQQPGLTGQVKEDIITRFWELGVRVARGEVVFEPLLLRRQDFLQENASWTFSVGGPRLEEELPAGSLAFTLCGVPVIYRLAAAGCLRVLLEDGKSRTIPGTRLGPELSRSLFLRDKSIRKIVVDIPDEFVG